MADEEKNVEQAEAQQPVDQTIDAPQAEEAAAQQPEAPAEAAKPSELDQAKADLAKEHDNYLRLAAEYDNFRKRSQKEKDNLYTEIKAETVEKFLPVYDNLERALAQQTADEAFKKGVEMTMTQLTGIFEKLGVTAFGEAGDERAAAERERLVFGGAAGELHAVGVARVVEHQLVASLGGAVGDGFDAGMLLLELHQARVQLFFGNFHVFQRAFQAAILKFHSFSLITVLS